LSYTLIKKLTVIALPVALLVATYAALHRVQLLPQAQRELACYAPYLALSGGVTLSLAFNRGRVFLTLLVIALFYLVARSHLLQGSDALVARNSFLFSSVLIPLNLSLICFMRERGVFSHSGRLRLAFVAAQVGALYWMLRFHQDYGAIPQLIARPLLKAAWLERFALPQSGLLFFVVSGVLISIRVLKRRYPIDAALLGALIALGITLNRIDTAVLPPLFVTAAILLLVIAVLQDSHSMAFSDDLTGLPSRRALNEQVMGLGRRYVVAMLDVDHFKRFNDTYGHDTGDQVLKMVGAKLAAVKGGGKSFRYGGEEFTVIFPRKGIKEVAQHLEELRQSIGNYELWIRSPERPAEPEVGRARRSAGSGSGKSVSVTVSIGLAASSEEMRSAAEVIGAADKALYRAKQRGRNQIAT
jgi:diguanylate cyclase (GGDEF)-like protein